MTSLVLDASAALAWCFADEQTASDRKLLSLVTREGAEAPSIWPLEVANVIVLAQRKGRLTQTQTAESIETIRSLPIRIRETTPSSVFENLVLLAQKYSLTIYDASYLELAIRLRIPLTSRDEMLKRAARSAGVALIEA